MKRGPKRQDSLIAKLEKLGKKDEMILAGESERNRALKWGRENRRFFVTRTHMGVLKLWRCT